MSNASGHQQTSTGKVIRYSTQGNRILFSGKSCDNLFEYRGWLPFTARELAHFPAKNVVTSRQRARTFVV
jgi:hypothetical protein